MQDSFLPLEIIKRSSTFQMLVRYIMDRSNLVIVGAPGTGKSTLLRAYKQLYGKKHDPLIYLEGRTVAENIGSESLISKFFDDTAFLAKDRKNRPLLVVDGLDEIDPSSDELSKIIGLLRSRIALPVVISTRPLSHQHLDPAYPGDDYAILEITGLASVEVASLLHQSDVKFTTNQLHRLVTLSNGNPLIVSLVASQLSSHAFGWDQLESAFEEFECAGILLPDGRPAGQFTEQSKIFVNDIATTNETLLHDLRQRPEIMRDLSPRKFEELVASMLEKQGYTVALTPVNKDGGFDIYVASKQLIGSFLYLVECKKYTPPNKVGVQIIRALHGIVQKTRANAGMLVTTSFFTKGAKEYADEVMYTLQLHDFLALKKWLKIL